MTRNFISLSHPNGRVTATVTAEAPLPAKAYDVVRKLAIAVEAAEDALADLLDEIGED